MEIINSILMEKNPFFDTIKYQFVGGGWGVQTICQVGRPHNSYFLASNIIIDNIDNARTFDII
jgi:hypothetical protein